MAPRIPRLALALAFGCASCGDQDKNERPAVALGATSATTQIQGCEIHGDLAIEPPRIVVGEHAFLVFRATTACTTPLGLIEGGSSGNRLGRDNSFRVNAIDAAGEEVPKVVAENDQGGANGITDFKSPHEVRLPLADYLTFTRPGRYEVTVEKALTLGKKPNVRETIDSQKLRVSAILEISTR